MHRRRQNQFGRETMKWSAVGSSYQFERFAYRSLQDHTSNEVFRRSIVTSRAIDENWWKHVRQGIDIHSMKVVHPVVCSGSSCCPVIGNIGLGEEICSIGGGVDDRSPNYADCVGDIRASNIGLQKWLVDLSGIDRSACLRVQSTDPIL